MSHDKAICELCGLVVPTKDGALHIAIAHVLVPLRKVNPVLVSTRKR